MNVGIVTTWFECGAAYVSKQYAKSVMKKHKVYVYTRGSYNIERNFDNNINVTYGIPSGIPITSALDLDDFTKWVKTNSLDVILFNEQRWWPALLRANELGVLTGAYVDYYTEDTVELFKAYDFLLCNTRRHFSVFEWHPQAFYIPWGTDVDLFAPTTLDPADSSKLVFFHSCADSTYRKGTDLLLDAYINVKGPKKLFIHSQGSLEKKMPSHKYLIRKLVSSGLLELYEKTKSAPGLYHKGDVYVYPSRLDGIGLTIAEALACGLPVITSDNPPMNEFIGPESCKAVSINRFFKRSDNYYWPQCEVNIQSLIEAMQWFVDNRADIADLKRIARQHAINNLDWMKNSSSLPSLLENLQYLDNDLKSSVTRKVEEYEHGRSSIGIMLYGKFPRAFTFANKLRYSILKYFSEI